jgi:hypothetical protein
MTKEPDLLISQNLINQIQQKQYIQNNKNFDTNNPDIDKSKNNYRLPKDDNNANQVYKNPESRDKVFRRDNAENPLANNINKN